MDSQCFEGPTKSKRNTLPQHAQRSGRTRYLYHVTGILASFPGANPRFANGAERSQ